MPPLLLRLSAAAAAAAACSAASSASAAAHCWLYAALGRQRRSPPYTAPPPQPRSQPFSIRKVATAGTPQIQATFATWQLSCRPVCCICTLYEWSCASRVYVVLLLNFFITKQMHRCAHIHPATNLPPLQSRLEHSVPRSHHIRVGWRHATLRTELQHSRGTPLFVNQSKQQPRACNKHGSRTLRHCQLPMSGDAKQCLLDPMCACSASYLCVSLAKHGMAL